MEENRKYTEPGRPSEDYDEIDLMALVRKLFKERKTVLKWCGIAVVIGLVVAFSIPQQFSVTSKLAPEFVARTNSSLSSLASLARVNLGTMNTADAVYPDLYPDIVSSTPFVVDLFPVEVHFKDKKEDLSTDYYTYLKDYTRAPWWSAVVRAPFKLLGWIRGLFSEKAEPVEGYADMDPSALTKEQAAVAKAIRESIFLMIDKKTSFISLTVTAQDPHVAAEISRELISRLQTYVTHYRTEKSRQDLEYFQQLYEEAKENYFSAQQRYANYVDRNQGVVLQRVRTEQERLQNEMNLNYQLYNTCAQQLQSAQAKVQQETPVFTVIDPPQVPLRRSKPSKAKILLVFVFLAGICSSAWVLWGRDMLADFKQKDEE